MQEEGHPVGNRSSAVSKVETNAEGAEGAKGADGQPPRGHGARERRLGDLEEVLGEVPPDVMEGTGKVRRRPREQTAEERRDHERSHEPYRDGCPACVAGRGRVEPHLTRKHGADAVQASGFNDGFLSEKQPPAGAAAEEWLDEPETATVLAGTGSAQRVRAERGGARLHGRPAAAGGGPGRACAIARWCATRALRPGPSAMTEGGESELATRVLNNAACATVKRVQGIEAVPEPRRRGESVAPNHACVQFMVMHGVSCLGSGGRDTSGKTPYERRYGRRWTGEVVESGERGMWLRRASAPRESTAATEPASSWGSWRAPPRTTWESSTRS